MGLFEADPVSGHHGFVESQAGLRAVPVNEFADGMIVRSLGTPGGQAIQDRRFRLFEIGEFQNGFRIAFAFVFCHSSSLHDLESAGWLQSMLGRFSLLIRSHELPVRPDLELFVALGLSPDPGREPIFGLVPPISLYYGNS